MKKERRGYPRANLKWPVVIETDKGTIDGVTSNVTPSGVFIHCKKPLRLNKVFEMIIRIPHSKRSLSAKAEVVWSNRYGPDDEITPRGMGVRFIRISSEERKFVARAALNYLESEKVAPELLQTLQTVVIDVNEDHSQAV